jgi:hypothetical protein
VRAPGLLGLAQRAAVERALERAGGVGRLGELEAGLLALLARERARKVRASYSEGPLVGVASARHQSAAELLQGMLLEEGIPSLLRRGARPPRPWVRALAAALAAFVVACVAAAVIAATVP